MMLARTINTKFGPFGTFLVLRFEKVTHSFPNMTPDSIFYMSFGRSLIKFIVKFLSNKYFYIKIPPFTQIKWGCSKKGGNREKGRNREIPL